MEHKVAYALKYIYSSGIEWESVQQMLNGECPLYLGDKYSAETVL